MSYLVLEEPLNKPIQVFNIYTQSNQTTICFKRKKKMVGEIERRKSNQTAPDIPLHIPPMQKEIPYE